jgi:hypothetical protein
MWSEKPEVGKRIIYDSNPDEFSGHVGIYHMACSSCKHYWGDWKCAAFPKRIPGEITLGEHDHTTPIEGNGGVMYEKKA